MDFVLLAAREPWNYLLGISLSILAIFLILLILVQRGRGGGLAGALGGMGGQSAFGTKAGDLFTRITIGMAAVWILLCMLSIKVLNPTAGGKKIFDSTDRTLPIDPQVEKQGKDKGGKLPVGEPDDAPMGDPADKTKPASEDGEKSPPSSDKPADEGKPEPPKGDAPEADKEKAAPADKPADEKPADSPKPKEE